MSSDRQPLVHGQSGPYPQSPRSYHGQPTGGSPQHGNQQSYPQQRRQQPTVDISSACGACMSDPGRILFLLMGFIAFLTLVCLVVGLGSTSWTTFTEPGAADGTAVTINVGLWEVCSSTATLSGQDSVVTNNQCNSIDTDCEATIDNASIKLFKGELCSKFQATRAFAILALFPMLIPALIALVASCNFCAGHTRRICFIVGPIFQFVGVLFGIIALSVYAGFMTSSPGKDDGSFAGGLCPDPFQLNYCANFGWSYAVFATAVILSFFLACCWFPMLCSPVLAPKKAVSQYSGYGAQGQSYPQQYASGPPSAGSSVTSHHMPTEEAKIQ